MPTLRRKPVFMLFAVMVVAIAGMWVFWGLTPPQAVTIEELSYDWVKIYYEKGAVELPAPYADDLRARFVEFQQSMYPWRMPGFVHRAHPVAYFYQGTQLVGEYRMYGGPFQMFQVGELYYKLGRERYDVLEKSVMKLVQDPVALKNAIQRGDGLQRVRAAQALLYANQERDAAIDVLRREVFSNEKKVAETVMQCYGNFKIADDTIVKGLVTRLADEKLRSYAQFALEQIGVSQALCP